MEWGFLARNLGAEIVGKHYAVTGDLTAGKACSYARFLEGDFGTASHPGLSPLAHVGWAD